LFLAKSQNKLKSIILGCIHYPYLIVEISIILKELYHYKGNDDAYIYHDFMVENIHLINPAVDTAKELYEYLKLEKLFNSHGNIKNSEFYISVPNKDNPSNVIDKEGRFPYAYKYSRNANEIQ
jgi:glutamate racemase